MNEKRRHIALLLPELESGGAQRVMLLLAREFATRDHRIDLVLLNAQGSLLAEVPANVRVVDLGARAYGLGQLGLAMSSLHRLAAWLKSDRPDAMLSTLTGANLVAVLARKRAKVAFRLVIREAITLANIKSRTRLSAMRWLYPKADLIVALTDYMRSELQRDLRIPAKRIVTISNPVDSDWIRAKAAEPLHHPWFEDESIRVVISVGRLTPQKDHATLIRAFAALSPVLNARLIIIGDGPERDRLQSLARELSIGDRLEMPGFDANPWRWMSRSSLFALSSKWEGHPNVLNEAIALGLPIVATTYDDSVATYANRYAVRCVPADSPRQMADAIRSELASHTLRSLMPVSTPFDTASQYLRAISED